MINREVDYKGFYDIAPLYTNELFSLTSYIYNKDTFNGDLKKINVFQKQMEEKLKNKGRGSRMNAYLNLDKEIIQTYN
ncbi:MAG: hypothetical protein KKF48_04860 [Nanoarchaeota archaeon]|nr:hypothetical protein [Nanoarchaeota archaeon]MBU1028348.1 hypothetical protein [Nanoarchaeota archaeon]